jgi:toxin ParE1/3/4
VAAFRLTRAAKFDFSEIAAYTLEAWGPSQTARYLDDLESCLQNLADNPNLGRVCDHILDGLRCMHRGRHVIFYLREARGIVVARILHDRMLPEKHRIDESIEDPDAEDTDD